MFEAGLYPCDLCCQLCRLRRGASTQEHLELLPPGLQDRAGQEAAN